MSNRRTDRSDRDPDRDRDRDRGQDQGRDQGQGRGRADRFPRRDEHGRVVGLADLLALTAAGLITGFVVLVLLDGAGSLVGWGEFGQASGWLALILPAWLFIIEELRAWREVPARHLVVISGALVAMLLGLLVAGVAPGPPLISSGVGAAAAAIGYALYWYHGIRWLAGRGVNER